MKCPKCKRLKKENDELRRLITELKKRTWDLETQNDALRSILMIYRHRGYG